MQQTRLIILTIISVTLFIGGIILLLSNVVFWSLYFAVPSIQIGIVLLILVFEKASRQTLDERIEEEMLTQKNNPSPPTHKLS